MPARASSRQMPTMPLSLDLRVVLESVIATATEAGGDSWPSKSDRSLCRLVFFSAANSSLSAARLLIFPHALLLLALPASQSRLGLPAAHQHRTTASSERPELRDGDDAAALRGIGHDSARVAR